jgi:hypothetical protein
MGPTDPLLGDALRLHGGRFFSEMLEVYFAVFGRGNTLNEHFLDCTLPHQKAWRECACFCVQFHRELSPAVSLQYADRVATLSVSRSLAESLTGNWALAMRFWREAWGTFTSLIPTEHEEALRSSLQHDWMPSAAKAMALPSSDSDRSLRHELEEARQKSEELVILYTPAATLKESLDLLYPNGGASMILKLDRLLKMIQGSLCLVPWAQDADGTPLPVVSIPAIVEGQYSSSWTLIPELDGAQASKWGIIQPSVSKLFSRALGDPTPIREREDAAPMPPKETKPFWREQNLGANDLVLELERLNDTFVELIKQAQNLTGISHEAKPISFSFIFGPAEVLKHVERVVSNEHGWSTGDQRKRPALGRQCDGHYALFQQDRIAGFVDQNHSPLCISKMVVMRSPTESDVTAMVTADADALMDDRYRALRWVTQKTWQEAGMPVAGLIAGGDGILRVFLNGRLELTWRRKADADKSHWQLGIECNRRDDGSDSGTRRLSQEIDRALGGGSLVLQLISTIWDISNTPGEGAVFIFGGKPSHLPVVSDMVPDNFKMQWARVRDLSGVEQQMLHSLAVMDGAVHIARCNNGAWVCARRFLSSVPQLEGVPNISAQVIVDRYFDKWIDHLAVKSPAHSTPEMMNALSQLQDWSTAIGGKGTRHRSVLQLCVWLENQYPPDPDWPLLCSISSDGPIKLYQVRKCVCGDTYLWTESIS